MKNVENKQFAEWIQIVRILIIQRNILIFYKNEVILNINLDFLILTTNFYITAIYV